VPNVFSDDLNSQFLLSKIHLSVSICGSIHFCEPFFVREQVLSAFRLFGFFLDLSKSSPGCVVKIKINITWLRAIWSFLSLGYVILQDIVGLSRNPFAFPSYFSMKNEQSNFFLKVLLQLFPNMFEQIDIIKRFQ
jgi:hypothetical protein